MSTMITKATFVDKLDIMSLKMLKKNQIYKKVPFYQKNKFLISKYGKVCPE